MNAPRRIRVLIVDDEPLARQRVADMLAGDPEVAVVGYATNGDGAIAEIADLDPDLVFLDVQMPGKTGIDVVREIGPDNMPATIFCTAYDQYALHAFDAAAVDYLLKPFDDERFEQALARAKRLLRLEQVDQLAGQLRALFEPQATSPSATSPAGPHAHRTPWLERIAVEARGQVRVVPVEKIDYITASGPYVTLHCGADRHVLRERMQALEERLDPDRFFRIHRSTIVQVDRIDALLKAGGGDYDVRLKNGTLLKVSRGRVEELEHVLGM